MTNDEVVDAQFRPAELAHSRLVSVEMATDLNAALVAAGDASATRTVYGVVIALAAIGVALLALAIWLLKQTKPELQLLAPLERMADRAWRQQEPAQKRRDLDSFRPDGARPVEREKGVPDVDADFAQSRPTLASFDDLQAQTAADVSRRSPDRIDPLLAAFAEAQHGSIDVDDPTEPTGRADPSESAESAESPGPTERAEGAPSSTGW